MTATKMNFYLPRFLFPLKIWCYKTQPKTKSIIDERAEENMNVLDHVNSHQDDGGENDVEVLMWRI
jgi:hypothetical protein